MNKFGCIIIAVYVLAFAGWCSNIVKLSNCDFERPYIEEVLRTIGVIIPPIGAIAGYVE